MRYINDYEYKLDWDIPHYSKRWYKKITTNPSQSLTQEHLDLYVASAKLIIAIDEKRYDDSLKYFHPVRISDIDYMFYKAYANKNITQQVIQTFKKMEQATTNEERLNLYLSLHNVDKEVIEIAYSHAKNSVDAQFEVMKRELEEANRSHFYHNELKELNDLKFNLSFVIDQKPLYDPIKNVEKYIETFEEFHQQFVNDLIDEIDMLLQSEERSGQLKASLEEAKKMLKGEKVDVEYPNMEEYAIVSALERIEIYKSAPSIQPLKEVFNETVKQYEKWLQMPLTEEEKQRIERAIEDALSAINHSYIENEKDLNWQIQNLQHNYKMIEEYLQRYTLSIITNLPAIDATFVPITLQIHDDYRTIDSLASNIKVKVTSENGRIIPETATLQNGKAQVLLHPKTNGKLPPTITAEIIDAPPKYEYLIGQKITRNTYF